MEYDLFVSYAREDASAVRQIVRQLAAEGLSIFWDRSINPGQQWSEVLEQTLRKSKAVLVVWSRASSKSAWVKAEATEAMKRRKLVPIRIDETSIPLPFGQVQTLDIALGQPLRDQVLPLAKAISAMESHTLGAMSVWPPVESAPTPPDSDTVRTTDWLHAFFAMSGRLGRKEYWLSVLIFFPVGILLLLLVEAMTGAAAVDASVEAKMKAAWAGFLVTLYPTVAITLKRLHDFGWSGWWVTPMLVLSLPATFAEAVLESGAMTGGFLLVALIGLLPYVGIGVPAGDPAANKYGPSTRRR